MKSRFEISCKVAQVRLYEDHPDKYVVAFSVFLDGNKGVIHSLVGKGFYALLKKHLNGILDELDVNELYGHVAPSHAKAIFSALGQQAVVENIEEVTVYGGRTMVWIKLTRLKD